MKYDSTGALLWSNHIAADRFGEYLAGDSEGNTLFVGYSITNGFGSDILAKYSPDGTPLWTNSLALGLPARVTVDSQGDVLALFLSGVTKYAPDGAPLWTNLFENPDVNIFSSGIIIDDRDDIYVAAISGVNVLTKKYAAEGTLQWSSLAPNVNLNGVNTPLRFLSASVHEVVLAQDYGLDASIGVLLFDYFQPPRSGKPGR